jgi:O-antigen ligase
LFASLFWCDEITRHNFQDALQLCMPIVVGLLAASAIRTHSELRWIFISFGVALGLMLLYLATYLSGSVDFEWIRDHRRGAACATMLIGCVFLAHFPQRKLLAIAGWGACLLITTVTSARMTTLALLAVPLLHPYTRGRSLSKFLAGGAILGLAFLLFNTKNFQERFFESGQGSIGDLLAGNVNDQGRSTVWSGVWNEAWRRPFMGAGVGAAVSFVPTVWGDMNHVHNDYLRIFYELGVVGLALFIAVSAWQLVNLRRQIDSTEGIVKATFTAAWLGFCALLITCLTDNTLVYNMLYTDPLFALLGAAYGAASAERSDRPAVVPINGVATPFVRLHPSMPKFD